MGISKGMPISPFKGKSVLVTGGTGSFGQKFVERILASGEPKKLIVFSRDEFKQHEMKQRFGDDPRLRFFLGDVRDLPRLERAFSGVDVVVHAAALKQVPALEYNPMEAIKTNVLGTQNVIDAALNNGVKKVVFVSTDKAVNPINLYGATKLCAEKLFIAANAYRSGKQAAVFSAVRYGNVIGSRGSLVELLQKQQLTGEVTLTDERMTRFWITLDEGVELVNTALSLMKGGEIFVPKLSAMKVTDLIKAMAPECRVRVIGVRPGEKIHEMLLTEEETARAKDIGKYYVIQPYFTAPHNNWWNGNHLVGAKQLKKNFRYSSDAVPHLTSIKLKRMIEA